MRTISCRNVFFLAVAMAIVSVAAQAQKPPLCTLYAQYHEPKGVEYEPERSAYGSDIAPADLDGNMKAGAYPIYIPIKIDLINRYGLAPDKALEPEVALVTIYPDGRVEYNGQDITSDVAKNCSKKE